MLCYDTGMEKTEILPSIRKGMESLGYTSLLPVQQEVFPVISAGEDVFIQAKTGSGKTAAYLIPVLGRVDSLSSRTQVLIIAPTRELAMQIHTEASALSVFANIHCICAIGGMDVEKQINALKHRPHVITATPGRLCDLLNQKKVNLSDLGWLIMDEADQIASTGQAEEMRVILNECKNPQRICVSATLDETVSAYLPKDYRKLIFDEEKKVNEDIEEFYILSENKEKTLLEVLTHEPVQAAVIFANMRSTVTKLNQFLRSHHILSAPFSSDYDEKTRLKTIAAFKDGSLRVICASDAMARGLDIAGITHVIHYNLPLDLSTYIHRSGRTAHQQNEGITVSLISPVEEQSEAAKWIMQSAKPFEIRSDAHNDLTVPLQKEKNIAADHVTILIRGGKDDKLRPKDIAGALSERLAFEEIGTIEIQDRYSLVTILNHDSSVLEKLADLSVKGKKRRVELSKK